MNCLEQMLEAAMDLLEELQGREKALKRILRILVLASRQKRNTRTQAVGMLQYELCRQRKMLEYLYLYHRITKKQKEKYERCIQFYEEYAAVIIDKAEQGKGV